MDKIFCFFRIPCAIYAITMPQADMPDVVLQPRQQICSYFYVAEIARVIKRS